MGLFGRKIPAREFVVVTRKIASALKAPRGAWVDALTNDAESAGIKWRTPIFGGEALRYLSMLQLSVVASCFADGRYFSPEKATLLLEWLYGLVAGDVPRTARTEIERFLQFGRPDEVESMRTWARSVAPLVAEPDSGQTQRQLEKWLPFIVGAAMISTYEACGDQQTARRIRIVGTNRRGHRVAILAPAPTSAPEPLAREGSESRSASSETRPPPRT